ncbi:flagellar basal body L-ring protein FlgH [Roseomonas marmotae]|uniref:Flagellar L-ring protein n=1 Tax=Roseomonas marmotae TaxID=2768161 RepID=A0ABS3KIC7_9PROT|nr:flagellar basal body L-ring protein FlgH [Roseomonas marmotae]MBO1076071.1 flagellar basal body L-ring protein FlgH [Roseomonas marmotae]QTI81310.1 flagellar basal body L-ring protein FlgH [Roseomonas marmotae]
MTTTAARPSAARALAVAGLLLTLAACDSWGHIQRPPPISAPGSLDGIPAAGEPDSPLAVATRPRLEGTGPTAPGSLWRPGSRTFFRDQRARAAGDLLTVEIEIDDSAQFDNKTDLDRDTTQSLKLPALFGLQGYLSRAFGGSTDPALSVGGGSSTSGEGRVRRTEKIRLQVAATVVRVLASGNLEIAGSQEIRVNDELRELQLRGLVRPEDIRPNNRIASEKIAEARISYGGRGTSSDMLRPRWGQQVLDRVLPY